MLPLGHLATALDGAPDEVELGPVWATLKILPLNREHCVVPCRSKLPGGGANGPPAGLFTFVAEVTQAPAVAG